MGNLLSNDQDREVISQYGLTEADCSKPVSEVHLESISRSSCSSWKSLPAHLGLETIVAEDADRSQADPREKRLEFFRQWKKIKGSDATYSQLINALLKIDCKQDPEKVCQILAQDQGSSDHRNKGSNFPPPQRPSSNFDREVRDLVFF